MNARNFPPDIVADVSQAVAGAGAQTAEGTGDGSPEDERLKKLNAFAQQLIKSRSDAIAARSLTERRWLDDLNAYQNRDRGTTQPDMMEAVQGQATQQGNEKKLTRSTVFVGITRSKTNAAEARLADLLFPVDDRNWSIRPTPVPTLADMVGDKEQQSTLVTHMGMPVTVAGDDGQQRQATVSDIAHQVLEDAKKKCDGMQKEIEDQLNECHYNTVGREVIHDMAVMGVGIVKGPAVTSRTRRAWSPVNNGSGGTIQVLQFLRELKPSSTRVSPWDFFPTRDCGENPQKGSGIWERKYVTARDLRNLATMGSQGYDVQAIAKVIKEGPRRITTYDQHQAQIQKQGGYPIPPDTMFELWEYHGEARREDLEAAGVDCSEATRPGAEELTGYSACVIMVNDDLIKADLNVLDTGDLPYDICPWEKNDGSWAGFGIPFLMRHAQKVVNGAWRAMMDNAGQTIGPQVVVNRKKITPADGKWTIDGRKLWWLTDEDDEVSNCFGVFEIGSHQAEYEAIIKMAVKFADEETSLPMIAQGEKGTAPDQVGSMILLMNSANVVVRRIVKMWDDNITRPHIGRYYDWNMQYNGKPEIKGDFQVDARGSSSLVVRDIQNQNAVALLKLAESPNYGYMIKKADAVRRVVAASQFDPDDFVHSDDEISKIEKRMAETPPQPSPDAMVRAHAVVQAATIKAGSDGGTAQAEIQDRREHREHELLMAAIEADSHLRELFEKKGINFDRAKADLAKAVITHPAPAAAAAPAMAAA